MYVLKNICFLCLTETDKNMMIVLHINNTADEIFIHVKYALPEVKFLDLEVPVYVCLSCCTTLQFFFTFKKKCLKNYKRWKHYIQILKETNDTQYQTYSELQVSLTNNKSQKKQKQKLDIEFNKKENEDSLLSVETFNKLQIKIEDKKLLNIQKPNGILGSNIEDKITCI